MREKKVSRSFAVAAAVMVGILLVLTGVDPAGAAVVKKKAEMSGAPLKTIEPNVIKFERNMKPQAFAGRPDTDRVRFSDGSEVSLGKIRLLTAKAKKMRAAVPGRRLPSYFKAKPGAPVMTVRNSDDLRAALKRSDNETVAIGGKRIPVGLLKDKRMQQLIEKRTGRSFAQIGQRPVPSGEVIKITRSTTKEDWMAILKKPDNTTVESPNGKRATVGELKQHLKKQPAMRASFPAKTSPVTKPKAPAGRAK